MLTANPNTNSDVERGMVLLRWPAGRTIYRRARISRACRSGIAHQASLAHAHDLAARPCALRAGPACAQLGEVIWHEKGIRARERKRSKRAASSATPRAVELYARAHGGKKAALRTRSRPASSAGSRAATISPRSASVIRRRAAEAAASMLRSCQRGHAGAVKPSRYGWRPSSPRTRTARAWRRSLTRRVLQAPQHLRGERRVQAGDPA